MFDIDPAARDIRVSTFEADVRALRVDLPPVPIGPVDVALAALDRQLEHDGPPAPAVPDGGWEAVAEARQDLLVDLDRDLRQADASRTVLMLDTYEASLRDLGERFGPEYAHRGSRGAQTVFKTIGLRLGMSPLSVAHLVDSATTLRDDLPLTWDAYLQGAATWRAADRAVAEMDGLRAEHRPAYDLKAAEAVVITPASRLKARLRTIRERLQDGTAGERAKRTHEQRNVTVDRDHDGRASLIITGPALAIIGFDEALTKSAIAARMQPDETRAVGQLRYDTVIDLLVEGIKQAADPSWAGLQVPGRKGVVPAPVLTIPALAALGASGEQAHLVGYGPLDLETAKRAAGAATSFIRVLTDPITGFRIDMDRKKRLPPTDMRRWVTLRDELCRFPGCTRPAHLCDLDHVQAWQDAGVTAVRNLVSACRPDHAAVSAELWDDELRENGHVEWENPWGDVFDDPPPIASDPAPPDFLPPPPADEPCPF